MRFVRPRIFVALFLVMVVLALAIDKHIPDIVLHNGLSAFMWAPLILACANTNRGPLYSRSMIFFGKLSFSLYLVHWTVMDALWLVSVEWFDRQPLTNAWLFTPAAIAISFVMSLALFKLVEEPARRLIMARGKALLLQP